MKLSNGLSIVMDDDTPTLLLNDGFDVLLMFDPKSESWVEPTPAFSKVPFEARSVSKERILSMTSGVIPTEFHSDFD